MLCSFLIDDNIYKYISNMGNILTPYSKAIGHKNICTLTPHFKFIETEKIHDNEMLRTNESSVAPIDNLISNCGKKIILKTYENIKVIQIMIFKYSYNNLFYYI